MPVPLTYPGVYITEIPGGSRTITGVATSITAFVGRALRGPVDEPVTIFTFTDFARVFGGLWTLSGLGYAVRDFYLNGGGEAAIVRIAPDAGTASLDAGGLALAASGPGAWGNALTASVAHPDETTIKDVADAQGVEPADLFHLTLGDGVTEETYLNVTVAEGPRRVDLILASSALARAVLPLPASRPAATAAGADPYAVAAGGQVTDGRAPNTTGDYVGTAQAASKGGVYALLKADMFNILCLPPPSPDSELPGDVWQEALTFCADQRAFLVVDTPPSQTVEDAKGWPASTANLTGVNARNGAVYFPRLRAADPLRGGTIGEFAPCGAVAGIMARTDASRGVWKAPAGIDAAMTGISGLTLSLTDDENGQLNPVAVNCLRTFRGSGTVIWGARTLRGGDQLGDEYKYVPVRRLALFLEETLYRSTQWVVFEPNDKPLWTQIRTSITAFMQDLFRQGAFQGTTPQDAYFVRCDEETTTQSDIDRGIVNIVVGFAPLKPAEFVVIGIQQKTATA
jgi:Bacteriophage tail sheath protein